MHFDAAVVFNTTTRACLAVALAGIRQRVMWGYKPAGFLLGTHRVMVHRSHPPIHEAQFALAFARRLGVDVASNPPLPQLAVDAATRQRVRARIEGVLGSAGPLFGVHPGSRNSSYNWPERHYVQLITQLATHGRVMVTGSPAEAPLVERIAGRVPAVARRRVGVFCDFPLGEMAAAMAELTSLTVSSTGPMHMAAVLGTPVVALFSPHPVHAPAKWAPLGDNHTVLVAPLAPDEDPRVKPDHALSVMARIAVDQVVEANLRYARRARAMTARASSISPPNEQAA
jgi:ADP-heptose:LPS heptosyltransferase